MEIDNYDKRLNTASVVHIIVSVQIINVIENLQ